MFQWRQGDVLPEAAAIEIDSSIDADHRMVVCSHSCDLVRMEGPVLAVAHGVCVQQPDGSLVNGKAIKTLQLQSNSGQIVNYDIESMAFVEASILSRHQPWSEQGHSEEGKRALSLWLSQRFDRLALPDDVVDALRDSGVESKLINKLKGVESEILDVRVLLDTSQSPPSISFLVLYNAGVLGAKEKAKAVANAITGRAASHQSKLDGRLVVSSATEVADTALRYSQFRMTRPYRVEHLSLRPNPPLARPPK